jgi:hypothetical protein
MGMEHFEKHHQLCEHQIHLLLCTAIPLQEVVLPQVPEQQLH